MDPYTPDPLEVVATKAEAAACATDDLHRAIRDARRANRTLREIADAAGTSHEQVRRVCA